MEEEWLVGRKPSQILRTLEADFCRRARATGYLQGAFTLRGGQSSPHFLDLSVLRQDPDGFLLCGRLLYQVVCAHHLPVRALAGIALGGVPPALALAQQARLAARDWPTLIVRPEDKTHGGGGRLSGVRAYPGGETGRLRLGVLIVEDVVTRGTASLEAVACLRQEGYEPLAVLALVDRQEGAREALSDVGVRLIAATTLQQVIEAC